VTEIPRSFSIAIQSEVAWRALLRPFTVPASWIAPPNSSSFSVMVVLPASGCEMIAKVRRRAVSWLKDIGRTRSEQPIIVPLGAVPCRVSELRGRSRGGLAPLMESFP
jgi:hypothetical protein